MFRPRQLALASLALVSLCACGSPAERELVVSPRPVPQLIAERIASMSTQVDEVDIVARVGSGALEDLEAVGLGEADLAIVPNSVEYRGGVRTVAVLYTGALHLLHRRPGSPASFAELIDGAKVYAGPEGSVERWLLAALGELVGLPAGAHAFVDRIDAADVVFLFAPILPTVPPEIGPQWRFFSLDDPEELGSGLRSSRSRCTTHSCDPS